MTDEELQALLDTASPGPWHLINRDAGVRSADMALIANAPALAAEVLALRAGAAASAERIKALEARVAAFEGALTPGAETKAAYIGEFKQVVGEENAAIIIEWTTVKEIMGAIRKFALLKEPDQ